MEYLDFLNQVINNGIISAKQDYSSIRQKNKLDGALTGFEACRNKKPEELLEIYKEISAYVTGENRENYLWFRCYQAEVEWVCNVVSAFCIGKLQPVLLPGFPTTNAIQQAAKIIENSIREKIRKYRNDNG